MFARSNGHFRVATALAAAVFASQAHSFPIAVPGTEGLQVFAASSNDIIATYQGNSASYSNDLYLNGVLIFNNQSTPVGTTANLGSFLPGTELIFRLFVNNTGFSFYTGAGTRNPDGVAHARVEENWAPSTTLVSFEDLFNGPFDYNDLSFSFSNTASTPPSGVPEPASSILVMLAGALLMGARWARSRC